MKYEKSVVNIYTIEVSNEILVFFFQKRLLQMLSFTKYSLTVINGHR